jgi:hypothetical protein
MATLSTEQVTSSGLEATPNAATPTTGDKVRPGSILRVANGGVASSTVTMPTPQTVDGDLAVADRTVVVPNGEARFVFASEVYRNPADKLVTIVCAPATSVTIEVIKS